MKPIDIALIGGIVVGALAVYHFMVEKEIEQRAQQGVLDLVPAPLRETFEGILANVNGAKK